MSFVKARSQDIKLENMRGTFLFLLKPQKRTNNDGTVKLTYSGSFLWPKPADLLGKTADGSPINVMEEAVKTAVEGFGDKAVEMIKNGVIPNPFLDGDGKQAVSTKTGERHPGFAGNKFIRTSATAEFPPTCFDDKLGADGKLVKVTDPKRMKWGAYYNVVTNILAWEHPQSGKGLSFGLSLVQFAKDGEQLGKDMGGSDPNSFFAPVGGAAAATGGDTSKGAGGLFA